MNRIFLSVIISVALLLPCYGLVTEHTNSVSLTLANVCDGSFNDFNFKVSGYDSQKFKFTYDVSLAGLDCVFRITKPIQGTIYLDVPVTDITVATSNITWTISRTNIPPPGNYYGELLSYDAGTTNVYRSLAQGKLPVTWSLYLNETNYFQRLTTNAQVGQTYVHPNWVYPPWVTTNYINGLSNYVVLVDGNLQTNINIASNALHTAILASDVSATAETAARTNSEYLQGLTNADFEARKVNTNDSRLTDARVPLAHNQGYTTITDAPWISGYTETDSIATNLIRITSNAYVAADTVLRSELTNTITTVSNAFVAADTVVSNSFTNAASLAEFAVQDGDTLVTGLYGPNATATNQYVTLDDLLKTIGSVSELYASTNTTFGIAGYYDARTFAPTHADTVITNLSATNTEYLAKWISNTNLITRINKGTVLITGRMRYVNTGGGGHALSVKPEVYIRYADTTEPEMCEGGQVISLTTAFQTYLMSIDCATNTFVPADARVSVKYKVTSQTGEPDWEFQVGSNYLNKCDLPSIAVVTVANTNYLAPNGNGSQLTGITAAQVGAVGTNDARYLSALTNETYLGTLTNVVVNNVTGTVATGVATLTISATGGSGFPLTNNASMGGYTLSNGSFVGNGAGLTNTPWNTVSNTVVYTNNANLLSAAEKSVATNTANRVQKTGDGMTGGLTNTVGFYGNAVNLTNFPANVALTNNAGLLTAAEKTFATNSFVLVAGTNMSANRTEGNTQYLDNTYSDAAILTSTGALNTAVANLNTSSNALNANKLSLTGGGMTGALTNTVNFVGNGAGLTNVSDSTIYGLTNGSAYRGDMGAAASNLAAAALPASWTNTGIMTAVQITGGASNGAVFVATNSTGQGGWNILSAVDAYGSVAIPLSGQMSIGFTNTSRLIAPALGTWNGTNWVSGIVGWTSISALSTIVNIAADSAKRMVAIIQKNNVDYKIVNLPCTTSFTGVGIYAIFYNDNATNSFRFQVYDDLGRTITNTADVERNYFSGIVIRP
jgi:hypothetical protein